MTTPAATPPKVGNGSRLTFMSPLSGERADRLVADLTARRPATIVDYGSGWGEFLVRLLASAPDAHGTGIELHGPDIVRGRALAAERGLADRVTFVEGSAADHTDPADLVVSSGAFQAFGSIPEALAALRERVRPGGRLLFAAEFWERTPSEAELAAMWPGMTVDDCMYLAGLVDAAVAAGFRPLRIETATRGEWEEFESGYGADIEEWLLDNPGHPEADELRKKLDEHLSIWLRGAYGVFGFAYLTLGVPV